jgi:hypothetical protein
MALWLTQQEAKTESRKPRLLAGRQLERKSTKEAGEAWSANPCSGCN